MFKFGMGVALGIAIFAYLVGTGERILPLSELSAKSKTPVILVGRWPDFVSHETNFTVGERLYFHLHIPHAGGPQKVLWRFQDQYEVRHGIAFNTGDIKDFEALARDSILTRAGFRIDAFFDVGDKPDKVRKVIYFWEPSEKRSVSERKSRYEGTGSVSYKDNKVIGDDNKICTINPRDVAPECPE